MMTPNTNPPEEILLRDVRKGDTVMWGPFRLTAIEHAQAELPENGRPGGMSCRFVTTCGKPYSLIERTDCPPIPLSRAPRINGQLDAYELIRNERKEQIAMGFDAAHDDTHDHGEIALGAAMFALPPENREDTEAVSQYWPWKESQFHPSDDRIHELVKAGAMIVAEIERLQRKNSSA